MKEVIKYVSESGEIFNNKQAAIEDDLIKELKDQLYSIAVEDDTGILNRTGNNITTIDRIIEFRFRILQILSKSKEKYGDDF